MKITFLSYRYWPPHFGGAIFRYSQTLESLAARGHNVEVLTSGAANYPACEGQDGFVVRRSRHLGRRRALRAAQRVAFFLWSLGQLRRRGGGVLHIESLPAFGELSAALMMRAYCEWAGRRGFRVVTSITMAEGDSVQEGVAGEDVFGILGRIRYSRVDRVVAVSPALQDSWRNVLGPRVVLIPNGVRDEIFRPLDTGTRVAVRQLLGVPRGAVVFIFVGSVGYRKGFDVLAAAFASLARTHRDWYLWVVGPKSSAESQNVRDEEVRSVLEPLGAAIGRTRLLGRVNNRREVARILGASDVFVLPTRREGMPQAPMEAMACGLPVIISRIPGVTDLANIDGETGLYTPVGDAEALRIAMETLGRNQALRREMGVKAALRIKSDFSWEEYLDKWEDLYLSLKR